MRLAPCAVRYVAYILAICCVWRVNHHSTAGRWFGGSWRSWPRGNKPHETFLTYVQVSHHERRISQIEQLNQMPLYPTEKIIWDENIVPTEYYSGEGGHLYIWVHCNNYTIYFCINGIKGKVQQKSILLIYFFLTCITFFIQWNTKTFWRMISSFPYNNSRWWPCISNTNDAHMTI